MYKYYNNLAIIFSYTKLNLKYVHAVYRLAVEYWSEYMQYIDHKL